MMKRKLKVVILTFSQGHLSLAEAARDFINEIENIEVKIIDSMNLGFALSAYRVFYRFLPFLFRVPYEISKIRKMQKMTKNYFIRQDDGKVLDIIKKEKPDVVISTYFGYIPVLEKIKSKFKFKYINIVPDPVTIHPISVSKRADCNFLFYKSASIIEHKFNIPKEKIIPTGWLTRKKFFDKVDMDSTRKKMGLDNNLTFLICGGSEGANAILSILPTLFMIKKRGLQIIFITGTNKRLASMINQTHKVLSKINSKIPKIVIKSFTSKLHKYMSASDMVIGKAGPNLLFESVAQRKPFIAITHISGQENGNLDIIRNYNIGWVAENVLSFNRVIRNIIEKPTILNHKKFNLDKLAKINYQAGELLKEKILEWKNNK